MGMFPRLLFNLPNRGATGATDGKIPSVARDVDTANVSGYVLQQLTALPVPDFDAQPFAHSVQIALDKIPTVRRESNIHAPRVFYVLMQEFLARSRIKHLDRSSYDRKSISIRTPGHRPDGVTWY